MLRKVVSQFTGRLRRHSGTARTPQKSRVKRRRLVLQQMEDRRVFAGLAGHILPTRFETTAIGSGAWSDPAVWSNGVPASGADVNIPEGHEITVQRRVPGNFNFVNVAGTLEFENTVDTRLRAETVRVANSGRLEIGTTRAPIAADRTAELVFTSYVGNDPGRRRDDANGFDPRDATEVGLGLLVEPTGEVVTAGQSKAAYVTSHPSHSRSRRSFGRGSEELLTVGDASAWRVGDEISIAATQFNRSRGQTETVRIRGIRRSGSIGGQPAYAIQLGSSDDHTVAYQLQFNHRQYRRQVTHVANLTRNIVFRPSDSDLQSDNLKRRGQVMSHSQNVQLRDVEFRDLGRTDKRRVVEDGEDGVFVRARNGQETTLVAEGTRDNYVNQRGRYPIHFHRTLEVRNSEGNFVNDWSNLATVQGSAVNGSPGWGFVSHSSGVDFIDNVSVGAVGSGFVSESGNEIGTWRGNLALDGDGSGEFLTRRVEEAGSRFTRQARDEFATLTRQQFGQAEQIGTKSFMVRHGDLARTGEGFWIQSPGLIVEDNVAAGMDGRGFAVYTQGLFETDWEEEVGFRPDLINWGDERYRVWNSTNTRHAGRAVIQDLAFHRFANNTAYASFVGLQVRFHLINNRAFAVNWNGRTSFRNGNTDTFGIGTQFDNFLSIRNEYGMTTSYLTNGRFNGLRVLSDRASNSSVAILAQQQILGTIRFDRMELRGYNLGIDFDTDRASFVMTRPTIVTKGAGGAAIQYPDLASSSSTRLVRYDLDDLATTGVDQYISRLR